MIEQNAERWIRYWDGGLAEHEILAIDKIEKTFITPELKIAHQPVKGGLEVLSSLKKTDSMFPWKGYAGFRFADAKGNEGEFDLLLVTHCNVLIIELKHWNGNKITHSQDKWFKGNKEMGRSPVSVTRNKMFLVKNKLDKLKNQFTNKGYCPFIEFLIVMTGDADFSDLPEDQKSHVIHLNDFLKLKDKNIFHKRFSVHPKARTLNQDFHLFDQILLNDKVKPKHILVNGYIAGDEPIFNHPQDIYQEYVAVSEVSKTDQALLRRWNFNKLSGIQSKTADGRFKIISREYDILQYIRSVDDELYLKCLRYKSTPQKDEMTSDYVELFELPLQYKRFNEFIGQTAKQLNYLERLKIVKVLLTRFSQLHAKKIAHRDLGHHSVWISPAHQVTLSGFTSAYYQPIGTLDEFREFLSVTGDLLSGYIPVSEQLTAFQLDVRSLAILAWHIIQAERLSPNSLDNLNKKLDENTEWYSYIFRQALSSNVYKNAEAFLNAFIQSEPKDNLDFSFEYSLLEPYIRDINHGRFYREDDGFIVETSEKEVYESNGLLVKAWLNIDSRTNENTAFLIFKFLEQVNKLKEYNLSYLPTIREFGIAQKSSSLFIVSDYIKQGYHWNELPELNDEQKLVLIHQLIQSVEHLHGLQFAHGDLHPENIKVQINQDRSTSLYLLDLPDFHISGRTNKNNRYSPENIEGSSEQIRDNYAVMRMSCELLGIDWNNYISQEYSDISEAIRLELSDNRSGFISLDRFKQALEPKTKTEFIEIKVGKCSPFPEKIIYPDNGELFVQIEQYQKDNKLLRVRFIGFGGILDTIYKPGEDKFTIAFPPKDRDTIAIRDKDESVLSIPYGLRVSSASYSNVDKLNAILDTYHPLKAALSEFFSKINKVVDKTDIELLSEPPLLLHEQQSNVLSTKRLWSAILDTETEALPAITAAGEVFSPLHDRARLIIPYETKADMDPLDQFKEDELIEAIGKNENDGTWIYGLVDLKHSTLSELHLKIKNARSKKIGEIKTGDIIFLQSKQNKVSFIRRKQALSRILSRESVINKLPEYFDEDCELNADHYDITVTTQDFARYDRESEQGSKISLNEQQCKAFQKLIENGPLSLLQGPPGTGKTEFIAAFVHYLFEKQKVQNVLLVSQSHEAVNTAAERIRRHCARLETDLQVVRFSNRETTVSDSLQDVFAQNIILAKRELFDIEKFERIQKIGIVLGLEANYLEKRAQLEFGICSDIRRHIFLSSDNSLEEEISEELKSLIKQIEMNIRESAKQNYHLTDADTMTLQEIYQSLIKNLNLDFAITPEEAKKAQVLLTITRDTLDVLKTERVNYDEFLARSRQLVTGTCVGIGQEHIAIKENIYDWVIIDEAARSISSELAIAMQSAKRILLVGDHRQLPPLYSQEHKSALARKLGIMVRGEELDQVLSSDFERAFTSFYGKQTSAQLLTQYRMAPAIGSLVSQCFYDGELLNGKQDSDVPDIYLTLPKRINCSVTWLDTSDLPNSYHEEVFRGNILNRSEADTIIDLLSDISNDELFMEQISSYVKDGEHAIGVICMYNEQKRLLRKKFNEKIWDNRFKQLVKIDTVDSYQGKENRIIILSITRHDKEQTTGFLHLSNRINVALSRAMDKLIIVGAARMWQEKNKHLPLGKVLNMIQTQSNKNQYVINRVLP